MYKNDVINVDRDNKNNEIYNKIILFPLFPTIIAPTTTIIVKKLKKGCIITQFNIEMNTYNLLQTVYDDWEP